MSKTIEYASFTIWGSIRLEKSITYEGEPDIDDVVLEEKVISE